MSCYRQLPETVDKVLRRAAGRYWNSTAAKLTIDFIQLKVCSIVTTYDFTALHFNLWKTVDRTQLNNTSIHIFKQLSFKKVSSVTLGCQHKFMEPIGLDCTNEYCVQAKYNKERADCSIKRQQTSGHPDRQQADPQWNRLGDKHWESRSLSAGTGPEVVLWRHPMTSYEKLTYTRN